MGDSAAAVKARLEANPKISGIALNSLDGICKFGGTEEELAEVLRDLVAAGARLVSFGEVKRTVEDLYMKLSHNEVM